ncbi:MAG: uroporphyrinogen-III C-methyltransferase [Candidatus Omnitrophica bacterium]|nr:uroporphyrinogen-III C-methyltransferase [Candidatus Omnitrophota bacterium]
MREKINKVYLTGAGPGDPGLITLKALKVLKLADAVVIDHLVNQKLLENIPDNSEIIFAGKFPGKHILTQDEINTCLVKLAKQGKTVVRLKGGDPFLFGRGAEEALFLAKHKIPFEIIPGVTSATAVPAYAGVPLTHRNYSSSVGIFTARQAREKLSIPLHWENISVGLETLVFLMGVESLPGIVENLIRFGRPKSAPCCIIEEGTLPGQKTIASTLGNILKEARIKKIKPPAIFVISDTVALRKKINWYENKTLFGKRILVTSSLGSSTRLIQALEDEGASCRALPLIRIKPLEDYSGLDSCIKQIGNFHWVIFTSRNAVKSFKQRMDYLKKDARWLNDVKIASIGPKTSEALKNLCLRVNIQPKEFCQEGLIRAFKKEEIKGKNILLLSSPESRKLLSKTLKRMGAYLKIVPAYRTSVIRYPSSVIRNFKDTDIIIFTSSSCVRNFFKLFPKAKRLLRRKGFHIASIGPVTSAQINRFGLRPDIKARHYTIEGIVEAIIRFYR